ncbi:MAG: hypothetical protein KGH98_03530 [Candidatus Micrarchaeota archaeon]|nr:hypothetical protein [Candidatus Micrarchaeota archaeon]
MRLQTSIEWMIIIAAIGAISIASLSAYSKFSTSQKALAYSLINQSAKSAAQSFNQAFSQQGNVSFYDMIPTISFVNQSNDVHLILSGEKNFSVKKAVVIADNAIVIPAAYYNVSSPGFSELGFSLLPTSQGVIHLSINASVLIGGSIINEHANGETYATYPQQPQGGHGGIYASIIRHNESLSFPLQAGNRTYTIGQWEHCSYLGFFGGELGIYAQCGSDASWYYWTFSDYCYSGGITEMTHCVYLNPTSTSIRKVSLSYSPIYNITVGIYNETTMASANLSSKAQNAIAYNGGHPVGTASVSGRVYGDSMQPYDEVVIMNQSGQVYPINLTAYDAYVQSLNNLFSVMGYYNKSEAGDGVLNIDEAISAYQNALSRLNSTPQADIQGCSLSILNGTESYVCKPFSVLTYSNITITLNGSDISQQLDASGSTINVR